ncbi:bifunctional [glutamine synthetase] adenylyltransferase/[glutamine synthetase]-adenylyl-L-tyrosine phosphorylase [Coralliovum pocilloporae]|uniref:bifunctional [glutamine synthetase] adenylyltransferase/[glutamine synthetase]-adenylyl-L-tyrosine phosphorylase n=1 Tax=Coralliovum pocilloporae TaxID=3066369 RepID=UPI0033077F88
MSEPENGLERVEAVTNRAALLSRIARDLEPLSPEAAEQVLSDYLERAGRDGLEERLDGLLADPAVRRFLRAILDLSPYLRDIAMGSPVLLPDTLEAVPEERFDMLLSERLDRFHETEAEVMEDLRRMKQEGALLIALADLAGAWTLDAVTIALTRLADTAARCALRFILRDLNRRGKISLVDESDPEKECGYIALAMGKHGAYELNYSSDIDLIIFFEPINALIADPYDAPDIFVRVTKSLVKILQTRDHNGYVFRTDLRLRPDPGATAAAVSVPAALQYYESMGQNWERAALIKARPCAGDLKAGDQFLKEIAPFIWRKYLDFAAIADIQSIKRQIHAHKGHAAVAAAGHNIKLGRGGIREVEFFVQTQQLIAGGRVKELRGRSTLDMLAELVRQGWIKPNVHDDLKAAYIFLRSIENRLQMVRDEQTHIMPQNDEDMLRIARMMNMDDLAAFEAELLKQLNLVQHHYANLFEDEPDLSSGGSNLVFTGDEDDPGTLDALMTMGFKRPQDLTRTVRSWHFGRYPATRSTKARERLTELTPVLIETFSRTSEPDNTFLAFDRFLSKMPTGIQLFSLLKNNPALFDLLMTVLGTAPRLTEIITRRVHAFDALLDPAFFGGLPSRDELADHLARSLSESTCYEESLDRARVFGQEQLFLIGVRVLSGAVSARDAGAAYTALADVIVSAMLEAVHMELRRTHGDIPGGRIALVAMGKLGGHEMTAGSDLDMILLYDMDPDCTGSDGPKSLSASQYYARLTQRLVSALSAPTAEGTIYEVDFRLRPSGNKGPLATHIDSFRSYQTKDAWTWEHMALTRARVIAGDGGFADEVQSEVRRILQKSRDADAIRADIADMRGRIAREKKHAGPWDIKLAPGGLLDIEFIAQTVQLLHAHDHPGLNQTNTEQALRAAADLGLLDGGDVDALMPAIQLYQNLTQVLRLALDNQFDEASAPDGLLRVLANAASMPDFKTLSLHLLETETAVRQVFERLVGSPDGEAGL